MVVTPFPGSLPAMWARELTVIAANSTTAKTVTFSSLQPELHIEIFKHLHTTDTIYLALTTTSS
jgi:hypothetical protein